MFPHAQGFKNLPGMHCNHVLQTFLELMTRLFYFFQLLTQRVPQIMANKYRSIVTQICDPGCLDFISNGNDLYCFELLGSADMKMYGDPCVTQKDNPLICQPYAQSVFTRSQQILKSKLTSHQSCYPHQA